MNLNTSILSHPRMQWELQAAMMRAVERSQERGIGIATAKTASGGHFVGVMHDRRAVPGLSFWRGGKDITPQITKALRE